MAQAELVMPKMGESIMEATILKWLKKEGDQVDQDEAALEIATDKVDSEVPVPFGGRIVKILHQEGAVVPVGAALAIIETESVGAQAAPSTPIQTASPATNGQPATQAVAQQQAPIAVSSNAGGARFYSPLVLNIAQTEGIGMAELETIPGSGSEGRVTKKDIHAYLANRGNAAVVAATPSQANAAPVPQPPQAAVVSSQPSVSISGNTEVIEMDRMRKLIADHMVRSVQTSPHVTSFVEADVTNLVNWRAKAKDRFEKKEGEKLTFTPMFIEAVAKAIKDFPLINVSVDGDKIIVKKDVNIGMAAALPSGNLIVPVIKNADQMNLLGLAKKVNDLANRARQNKLTPDEIQGGTYTVTNVGTFGNVMGTPIINQPQVAILALGAIRKKPAVIETAQGDLIGIRHMMFLSHSYDHRVVDGALGGMFVRRVADYLEQWDMDREW